MIVHIRCIHPLMWKSDSDCYYRYCYMFLTGFSGFPLLRPKACDSHSTNTPCLFTYTHTYIYKLLIQNQSLPPMSHSKYPSILYKVTYFEFVFRLVFEVNAQYPENRLDNIRHHLNQIFDLQIVANVFGVLAFSGLGIPLEIEIRFVIV